MRRPPRRLLAVSALIGLLTTPFAATVVPAGATASPSVPGRAGLQTELVGDDAFVSRPAGEPAAATVRPAGAGYAVLPSVVGYALSSYTVRLVDSPGIEQMRSGVESAAAQIAAETGLGVSVAGGTVADRASRVGEILVRVSTTSQCGALSMPGIAGCGGPSTIAGRITDGDVNLAPQAPCDALGTAVVTHELGHAFGLDHYTQPVDGLLQLMYPSTDSGAPAFRAGDRAGLRALAGRALIAPLATGGSTAGPTVERIPSGSATSTAAGTPMDMPVDTPVLSNPIGVQSVGSLFSQPAVQRVLDTRTGVGLSGRFTAGSTRTLSLSAAVGATQVDAVVLNLTTTGASAGGYVTAYPDGSPLPATSSANYVPGADAANLVIVKVGPGNTIDLFNSGGSVDLLADLFGVFSASGTTGFVAASPTRVLDTRESPIPGERGFPLGCTELRAVTDARLTAAGVPLASAVAEVVNLTAAGTTAAGFVSFLPTSPRPAPGTAPSTSNLNVAARDTRANLGITPGARWYVETSDQLSTDVIGDLAGWFVPPATDPTAARFVATEPTRVLDTRTGVGLSGRFTPGVSRTLGGLLPTGVSPDQVTAVVANVTVAAPDQPGYVTLSPTGSPRPDASNVNYDAGETVPNLTIVKLGTGGALDVFSNTGNPHVIVDVMGYFVKS